MACRNPESFSVLFSPVTLPPPNPIRCLILSGFFSPCALLTSPYPYTFAVGGWSCRVLRGGKEALVGGKESVGGGARA